MLFPILTLLYPPILFSPPPPRCPPVRCQPKTSVVVLAAVEVELEGRHTTGWLEKKVELVSVPL